jgi:hypothetical protein
MQRAGLFFAGGLGNRQGQTKITGLLRLRDRLDSQSSNNQNINFQTCKQKVENTTLSIGQSAKVRQLSLSNQWIGNICACSKYTLNSVILPMRTDYLWGPNSYYC